MFVLDLFRRHAYTCPIMTSLLDTKAACRASIRCRRSCPGTTRGRGSRSNATGRFESETHYLFDDGWDSLEEAVALKTEVFIETAKTIITRNESPDISFDRSINPYRGCEHGCSYCYARPTHAYVGLSPGLDFESKIFAKTNAVETAARRAGRSRLRSGHHRARRQHRSLSADRAQILRLTRGILEVLSECEHPVGIVTKSALVVRDIDLLQPMAEKGLVKVAISSRLSDPSSPGRWSRAPRRPARRLQALEILSRAGIPTVVMVAPIIPALNDSEIEAILKAASAAGVREAGYVLLRLPLEVKDIFREWLMKEMPDRAAHAFFQR